ncbi:hypothetical protein AAG747_07700 [Rapidithrix thailandica]|uniref:Uncharacterized protein n=1 Tax=Rapidithrix thailandica TaxID=413964 RepID=A0AAW9RVU3_9BACT
MMHSRYFKPALLLLALLSMACRFNVREIGFAELSPDPYVLYYFYNQKTAGQTVSTFEKQAKQLFNYSNIKVKAIDVDMESADRAIQYLSNQKTFPQAVLLAPDGRIRQVELAEGAETALKSLIISPLREEILANIVQKYGIVLLLEGTDAVQNKQAEQAIERQLEEIKQVMVRMPKVVKEGPVLLIVKQDDLVKESTLLWSLGIDPGKTYTDPQAVILYGRARKMGEVLKAKEIQSDVVYKLLSLIGADCECGLDRKWMMGPRIPLEWTPATQTRLSTLLNFDVDNPMVMAEMSQILSIEAKKNGRSDGLGLFEPKEISLSDQSLSEAIPEVHFDESDTDNDDELGVETSMLSNVFYALGVLAVIVIGGGIWVMMKK